MNIITRANEIMVNAESKRVEKLEALNAPQIIIARSKQMIREGFKINDKGSLGSLEFSSEEIKKGRGGKVFFQFSTKSGLVNFFPSGKYGPFISINK